MILILLKHHQNEFRSIEDFEENVRACYNYLIINFFFSTTTWYFNVRTKSLILFVDSLNKNTISLLLKKYNNTFDFYDIYDDIKYFNEFMDDIR